MTDGVEIGIETGDDAVILYRPVSSREMTSWARSVGMSAAMMGFQKGLSGGSRNTIGVGTERPVCTRVRSSNVSSSVPNPPGRHTNPCDSFMSISFLVKK
jgi:hypothetical protein